MELSGGIINLAVFIIITVGVAIPIVNQTVLNVSLTGIAGTILPYTTVLLSVVPIVVIAKFLQGWLQHGKNAE